MNVFKAKEQISQARRIWLRWYCLGEKRPAGGLVAGFIGHGLHNDFGESEQPRLEEGPLAPG
jgi:hypothetical protein